jgi:hypothetical protein
VARLSLTAFLRIEPMLIVALLSAVLLPADTSRSAEFLDRYREITSLAPLAGQVAEVSNLVLRRDAAEISLTRGTLYLLSPVGGRTVGAIFRGAGRIRLTPPHPAEQEALRRVIGAASLNDSITEVILIFADSTAQQLASLKFTPGEVTDELSGAVHDCVQSLRGRKDGTLTPGVMESLLNDEPNGFFLARVRRAKGSPLLFQYDPAIVESVQLLQPANRINYGADWSVVTQFAPSHPSTSSAATWRYRHRVGVPRYQVEVWLKPTPGADLDFAARATVALTAQESAGPWLRFGLHPELMVDSARWSDGAVAATFKVKDDDELWVRFPRRLGSGDSASLTLFYHGDLIDRYDNWFFLDPTADWYPTNRQGGDAARFDLTFHSPAWYPLASIGELTDSSVDGKVMTTRWVTKRPTSFATFNLGLFKTLHVQYEGAPALDVMMSDEAHRALRNALMDRGYMLPAQRNMAQVVAADVSNSLKWFTHAFGPPLFDHFYVTEIPYFEGVSFPGMIDLSWSTFQNTAVEGFDEFFRAHEVAHQWWGNGVRPASYRDVWLSEGVASFCGLWYLQSIRKGNKEYFRFLDSYSQNIKDNRDAGPTWLGYRTLSVRRGYEY